MKSFPRDGWHALTSATLRSLSSCVTLTQSRDSLRFRTRHHCIRSAMFCSHFLSWKNIVTFFNRVTGMPEIFPVFPSNSGVNSQRILSRTAGPCVSILLSELFMEAQDFQAFSQLFVLRSVFCPLNSKLIRYYFLPTCRPFCFVVLSRLTCGSI